MEGKENEVVCLSQDFLDQFHNQLKGIPEADICGRLRG